MVTTAATIAVTRKSLPAVAKPTHLMPLRPGFLLLTEFSAKGGVKFERTGAKRAGDTQNLKRIIDSPQLEKLTRAITNGSYGLLMQACANTPIGFFADQDMLDVVNEEIGQFKQAAHEFNTIVAPTYKSERRMTIDIFPVPWNTKDQRIATRIQRMICEHLTDLKAAMKTMHRDTVKMHFDRMRNMEKITLGVHHDKIKAALDSMREQRKLLTKEPTRASVAEFDFKKIDAAIAYLS